MHEFSSVSTLNGQALTKPDDEKAIKTLSEDCPYRRAEHHKDQDTPPIHEIGLNSDAIFSPKIWMART